MCNPSCSAEPSEPLENAQDDDSALADDTDSVSARQARGWRADVIRRACKIGPYTVFFIDQLWADAAQQAFCSSLEILMLARWYSAYRLEHAIHRAMDHDVDSLSGLRYILEEGLDQLDSRSDADLGGQLTLSLATEEAPEDTWQTENAAESTGFPHTRSWK